MKIASKVFLILGMIIFPVYALVLFFAPDSMINIFELLYGENLNRDAMKQVILIMAIMMSVISVIALVIGIFAIQKIHYAASKKELIVFGVLSILFVSVIGGILMLCIPNEELNAGRTISLSEISAPTAENSDQKQE